MSKRVLAEDVLGKHLLKLKKKNALNQTFRISGCLWYSNENPIMGVNLSDILIPRDLLT